MFDFLYAHRLCLGILADFVTLAGALILAYEAFGRLSELVEGRVESAFAARYPELAEKKDREAAAARRVVRYAWTGALVLVLGFALQVLTRAVEAHGEHVHESNPQTLGEHPNL